MNHQLNNPLGRISTLIYGVICYLNFLVIFLYFIAFINNIFLPKTLDSARIIDWRYGLLINVLLLLLFGLQHSGMARPKFKQIWTKIIPTGIERSTYVLLSSLCLVILMLFWQPLGVQIWQIENILIFYLFYGLNASGWLLVLVATFSLNHFDLFGLRQVFLHFQGKEYTQITFETPILYRIVRHPLYVGFLMGMWFTPSMTISHLIFAMGLTVYILAAIQWEEKDLIEIHGESYRTYQKHVPMLIPKLPIRMK
jgi:protein-S-isoprenylcysteine O-methyltransferase Ste14